MPFKVSDGFVMAVYISLTTPANEDGKLVKKVMPVKSMAPGAGNRMVVRTFFPSLI